MRIAYNAWCPKKSSANQWAFAVQNTNNVKPKCVNTF